MSWQHDASEYKTLLEKQRCEAMLKMEAQRTEIEQLKHLLQKATIREELATQSLESQWVQMEARMSQTQEAILSLKQTHLAQQDLITSLIQKDKEWNEIPVLIVEQLKKFELMMIQPASSIKKMKKRQKNELIAE